MAKFIVVLAFLSAAIAVGYAVSLDENSVKTLLAPFLQECGKEIGVSDEDLLAATASKNFDAIDPCYYACFFKKFGLMDDAGNFKATIAKEKGDKFLSDPEDLKKAAEVADTCASVNDAVVSDGAKGCDRAKLLAACLFKEFDGYKSLLAV